MPEINVKSFEVNANYLSGCQTLSKFEISKRHELHNDCNTPDKCIFDLDLAINVALPPPPCPQIRIQSLNLAAGYAQSPGMEGYCFYITSLFPGEIFNIGDEKVAGRWGSLRQSFRLRAPPPASACLTLT
jgi:hypothetical protein